MSEPFLTQSRFPRLWLAFQLLFDDDKKKIVRRYIQDHKRVLEVGCSAGNMSAVFCDFGGEFVGIDIDEPVLEYAKRKYSPYPQMKFLCLDLTKADAEIGFFDLVMFNGMCHHVDTGTLERLLQKAITLLAPGGTIVVSDLIIPGDATWLELKILEWDRGTFHRSSKELVDMLSRVPGVRVISTDEDNIRISFVKWPKVARYVTVCLAKD